MTANANRDIKWGLMPSQVTLILRKKYWENRKNLRALLSGTISLPLEIALKPPKGQAALINIEHFQHFITSWRQFSAQHNAPSPHYQVCWTQRTFRALGEQEIPSHLSIYSVDGLTQLLGQTESEQLQLWRQKIAYLLHSLAQASNREQADTTQRTLFLALITHLDALDKLNESDLTLIVQLIAQLQHGMGRNSYLRALPVTTVDTKFIESNLRLIEAIVAATIEPSVTEKGLLHWLDCRDKPKHWLLVKPLCARTTAALSNIPLLRLSSDTLLDYPLPAKNILVIENEQSCLTLNNIPDTIAVSGGGKNIAWLQATWLNDRNIAYWGDIDSEGFHILSAVRSKRSHISTLMMDSATVKAYQTRMVDEPSAPSKEPIALTDAERTLYRQLRAKHYHHTRLEQERLPLDYITHHIMRWIATL